MAFTVTVNLGYTPTAGVPMSVADFIALGLPNISVTGAAGTADISDGAITWPKLSPTILGTPSLTTVLGDDDRIVFHDASTNTIAVMDIEVFGGQLIGNLVSRSEFESYTADKIPFYRSATGDGGVMSPAVFAEQLIEQAPTADATADEDKVLAYDTSAPDGSRVVGVTLSNLLPNKIEAGTYAVHGLKVDAKGRITEINPTSTAIYFDNNPAAANIPAAGDVLEVAHGLGSTPMRIEVTLKCLVAGDRGYVVGDEVAIHCVLTANSSDEHSPIPFSVARNATHVIVGRPAGTAPTAPTDGIYIPHRDTGEPGWLANTITNASWAIRVRAWK